MTKKNWQAKPCSTGVDRPSRRLVVAWFVMALCAVQKPAKSVKVVQERHTVTTSQCEAFIRRNAPSEVEPIFDFFFHSVFLLLLEPVFMFFGYGRQKIWWPQHGSSGDTFVSLINFWWTFIIVFVSSVCYGWLLLLCGCHVHTKEQKVHFMSYAKMEPVLHMFGGK